MRVVPRIRQRVGVSACTCVRRDPLLPQVNDENLQPSLRTIPPEGKLGVSNKSFRKRLPKYMAELGKASQAEQIESLLPLRNDFEWASKWKLDSRLGCMPEKPRGTSASSMLACLSGRQTWTQRGKIVANVHASVSTGFYGLP